MKQKDAPNVMMRLHDFGSKYKGQLNSKGQRHGSGRATYINGSVYFGDWKEGLKHGIGTQKWTNGTYYSG